MSSGKSPGDDGLPTYFYEEFVDLIAPKLVIVFKDAIERGTMPESMQSAVITLIHKKGKDAQICGNYRPVSLINVDAKILAKILALRHTYPVSFIQTKLVLFEEGHQRIIFVGYYI